MLNDGYKTVFSGFFIFDMAVDAKNAHVSQQWQQGIVPPERYGEVEERL